MTYNIWEKIREKYYVIFNETEEIVGALAHSIIANGGPVLIQAAKAAVESAASTQGTGEEKRQAAISSIVRTLTTAGLPVVMNAINGAIEAAVAQRNFTTVPIPAPAKGTLTIDSTVIGAETNSLTTSVQ